LTWAIAELSWLSRLSNQIVLRQICNDLTFISDNLDEGASTSVTMGIDFNDTTQPANFEICTGDKKLNVTVKAPVGELLLPISMSENEFNQQQSKWQQNMTQSIVQIIKQEFMMVSYPV
jgi:hypothetical protein